MDNSLTPEKRTLKRKNDSILGIEFKRKKTECEYGLLVFPDDILLLILSYLPHNSILALSKTCTRLKRVCADHTLWRNVVFSEPTSTEDLQLALRNIGPETKSFDTIGHFLGTDENDSKKVLLSCNWMAGLRQSCHFLTSLSLKHHYIDCNSLRMSSFPHSLVSLDLSNTCLKNEPCGRSYFRDISKYMPELEVLILSNCHWFEPHSLMALSKCPKLQELKLDGCQKVKDCVAYCGLATRGGFKALRTLDLRKCPIGCSELVCFASVTTITKMYLQNPVVNGDGVQPIIDSPIFILFTKEPMIEIRADGHPGNISYPRLKIERLVVQNYCLTDECLIQLAKDALNLKSLDITSSHVSQDAVNKFVELRPEVEFIR